MNILQILMPFLAGLFFLFGRVDSYSQPLPVLPADGTYVQQPLFGLIEGTWNAVHGNEELTIVFKFLKKRPRGKYFLDNLIGWFEYKIDGEVQSSTLQYLGDTAEATLIAFDLKEVGLMEKQPMVIIDPNRLSNVGSGYIQLKTDGTILFAIERKEPSEQVILRIDGKLTGVRPTQKSKLIENRRTWTMTKVD